MLVLYHFYVLEINIGIMWEEANNRGGEAKRGGERYGALASLSPLPNQMKTPVIILARPAP